jgi:hypothetical protein
MSNPRWVISHGKRILVEDLDLPGSPVQIREINRQRKRREAFVQLPLNWAARAARCTRTQRALVWMLLSYLAWKHRCNTFPISNALLAKYGVGREVKRRALAQLEAEGLICVKRHHKHALEVTLVDWAPSANVIDMPPVSR